MPDSDPQGKTADESADLHEFHMVGVGASAGGLEALENFFEALPDDSGMAFIVIQHLSPDFKSHMEQLLARRTGMSIFRVENGMRVEPNCIYLIPPKMEMVITEGKLLLTEKGEDRGISLPIDQFFRSLASDIGRYSIGVILSGTGSDGSRGIRDIHDAGGLVLSQDEKTAKFDGMPLNAAATGIVDLVLTPAGIAGALVRFVRGGVTPEAMVEEELIANSQFGFDRVFQLLNQQHGLDFSHYKVTTVGRRIQRRIELLKLKLLEEYVEHLENDAGELNELYKDLLIGVTQFFRDTEAFAAIEKETIPRIIKQNSTGEPIRAWVAGCASGEEAYSIAILLDEAVRHLERPIEIKIFATDAHHVSLAAAAKGVYPEESLVGMSDERKQRYFRKKRDGYHVTRELRSHVVFAPHNLISDAPFTQMDLVTCRNLLIYLQPQAQRKSLAMFHFALKTNGTLFLGPSESPGELEDEFKSVNKRWRIYLKKRDIRLPRLPLGSTIERKPDRSANFSGSETTGRHEGPSLSTYDQLLDRRMPPSFLVNDKFDLLHTFGGAEKYLRLASGRPTNNLLDLINSNLKSAVTGALQHAVRKQDTVRYSGIHYKFEDRSEEIQLVVEPIRESGSDYINLLVEFEVVETPDRNDTNQGDQADAMVDVGSLTLARVSSLESELRYSQENLQASTEEMQTSNEELQATNEELTASNEELQSTNEELHSVNEELYTVNAENQRRMEEIAQANADMDNLLATTRVGVIFLDAELFIRRFTPEIARMFHLVPQDVGRSIEGFVHNLKHDTLIDDLNEVLERQSEKEVDVEDLNGSHFLLRMLPYRSGDEVVGVVLTLIDISSMRQAQSDIQRFKFMTESALDMISLSDQHGNLVYVNPAYSRGLGYSVEALTQMTCMEIDVDCSTSRYRELFEEARQSKVESFETNLVRSDNSQFPVEFLVNMLELNGQNYLFSCIRDVSGRIEIEQELRLQKRAIEAAVSGITIADATQEGLPIVYANSGFLKMTGFSLDEVIGKNCRFLQGPDTEEAVIEEIRSALKKQETCRVTLKNYRKDGAPFWNDLSITPVFDSHNKLTNFVGVQSDISGAREARSQLEAANKQIDNMLKSIMDGFVFLDHDWRYRYVNPQAATMLGREQSEMLGECIWDVFPAAKGTEFQTVMEQAVDTRLETTFEEFYEPLQMWIECRCYPSDDGLSIFFIDTTERRETLERLKLSEQAYRESEQRAQAASLAKSEFLANMSHELRTPMTAVLGFADILNDELVDAKALEKVATIKRNGSYLLSLLNDILDLSKIEAGKLQVVTEAVDIRDVIGNVQKLMSIRSLEEGVPLQFEWKSKVPISITADHVRIRQILVNLIGNALKFTNDGAVTVAIEFVQSAKEPVLNISVIDTGIGMNDSQIKKLFRPFSQADIKTAREFGGTGLGLSISKRLADAMGASIAVESTLDRGSTFTVSFPVTEIQASVLAVGSDVKPSKAESVSNEFPTIKRKILLADDRRDVWRIGKYFLEKCGATVVVAEDGQQAVEAAVAAREAGEPFDLVLMDMQMPVMTGREAVGKLRELDFTIPIIALTADAMVGERDACLEIGCNDFLPKPIDGPKLVRLIAATLSESSA
jgi:two-component system CheB/CheR fusion protein